MFQGVSKFQCTLSSWFRSVARKKNSMGLPLVEKLIVPEKNMDPERQEIGFYRFNFFWFGQWNPVWVDDYVRTGYINVGDEIYWYQNENSVTNITDFTSELSFIARGKMGCQFQKC